MRVKDKGNEGKVKGKRRGSVRKVKGKFKESEV